MAGRKRTSHEALDNRHGYPPEHFVRRPLPRRMPPHPAILEEELEIQHMEIRRLVGENRRLVEDRIALQQELGASREELHRMNLAYSDICVEQEARSRELVERMRKLENDIHATEKLKTEIPILRADVKKLDSTRKELISKIQNLTQERANLQAENKQIPILRDEINELHQEFIRARTAIEYEKKANIELMDQQKAMEKNLLDMAREGEKLRAELTTSVGRTWAPGGPYQINHGPDGSYPAPYREEYGVHQGGADKGSLYVSSSRSWGHEKPQKSRY
ncbi:hypothetical protein Leryth_001900 [Lithospermum erythrorhizon]|nr:hypothetical protein Leryth_001900 [Lithospermum erythrorhizon]